MDQLEFEVPSSPPATRLSSPPHRLTTARTLHPFPPTLLPLLSQSLNSSPLDFSLFVTHPPAPFAPTAGSAWTKLGEASYSEVFTSVGEDGENLVIKIIPIAADQASSSGAGKGDDVELPFMSDAASVMREIEMSRMVGGDKFPVAGFVKFKGYVLLTDLQYTCDLVHSPDNRVRFAARLLCKARTRPPSSTSGTCSRPRKTLHVMIRYDQVSRRSDFWHRCDRELNPRPQTSSPRRRPTP